MIRGIDHNSVGYLHTVLIRLAIFCIDCKTSYSIFLESINQLRKLPTQADNNPDYMRDLRNYNTMRKRKSVLSRISLNSFIISCADISKTVWPFVDEGMKDKNKLRKRQIRKDNLEKLFSASYPNLRNRQFRNFLELSDDELDKWNETSSNNSISFNSIGSPSEFGGNITLFTHFDPVTFTITYYHKEKGSEIADVKEMYQEVELLHKEIPKALSEISGTPENHFDFVLDM
jgi:hypothetical protein